MTNELKNVPELRFPEFDGEWEKKDFYKCVEIDSKLVNPRLPEYQNLPHIGPGNIQKNTGRILNYNLVKDENLISGKFEFNDGDIIYGKINPQLQKICAPRFKGLASADSYPIKPIKEISNMKFIYYSLFTSRFFKYSVSVSMRTGMPKINRDELGGYKFYTTLLSEQQKIGEFFSKLDRQIELEEQKLAKLEEQKKGYMQKIFSQELRFKDANGNDYPDWKKEKLDNILEFESERTKVENEYPVLTSSRNGLILQSEYYKEGKTFADSNIGYFIIPKGYITYRSRSDDGKFQFNLNNIIDVGIVSKYYPVFRGINMNQSFLTMLMNHQLKKEYIKFATGTSQLVLSQRNLREISTELPITEEQEKIGNFFDKQNSLIEKQSSKIGVLKQRKKGFLQKMFV